MNEIEKKIQEYQKELEEAKRSLAQAEGARHNILAQLKEQFDIDNIKNIEKMLKQLNEEKEELEEKLASKLGEIEEKYGV